MAQFGRVGLEELLADRGIEEQVSGLDAHAGGAVPGADRGKFAAVAEDLGTDILVLGGRLQSHTGDAADRRQRLAAEAHRADAEQIVGLMELAGGMAGEGERQVVRLDAAAVVDDADQLRAALLEVDLDARRQRRWSFRAVP